MIPEAVETQYAFTIMHGYMPLSTKYKYWAFNKIAFMANLCHQQKKKLTYTSTSSAQNVCPILTKFAITRQIVIKIPNSKFQENQPVGAAVIDADILT